MVSVRSLCSTISVSLRMPQHSSHLYIIVPLRMPQHLPTCPQRGTASSDYRGVGQSMLPLLVIVIMKMKINITSFCFLRFSDPQASLIRTDPILHIGWSSGPGGRAGPGLAMMSCVKTLSYDPRKCGCAAFGSSLRLLCPGPFLPSLLCDLSYTAA